MALGGHRGDNGSVESKRGLQHHMRPHDMFAFLLNECECHLLRLYSCSGFYFSTHTWSLVTISATSVIFNSLPKAWKCSYPDFQTVLQEVCRLKLSVVPRLNFLPAVDHVAQNSWLTVLHTEEGYTTAGSWREAQQVKSRIIRECEQNIVHALCASQSSPLVILDSVQIVMSASVYTPGGFWRAKPACFSLKMTDSKPFYAISTYFLPQ